MDQIDLFGFINPQIYLLFLMLYPVSNNRYVFMLIAFVLGLSIDTFNDTGGAHAAASLTVAFCRPLLLRLVYGEAFEMKNIKVISSELDRVFLFSFLLVLVHHLVLHLLIVFDLTHFSYLMKMWFFNSLVSFILCVALLITLRPKRKI